MSVVDKDNEGNFDMHTISALRSKIEFDDLPIWRDSINNFKPLEQLFGALSFGCSFGELSVINVDEDQKRFYSTIAVTNAICVSLSRKRLQ